MKIKYLHRVQGWRPHDCYMTCAFCDRTIRYSEHKVTWDNFVTCADDWYPKHPSHEKIPVVKGEMKPFPRATGQPVDRFIPNGSVNGADLIGH